MRHPTRKLLSTTCLTAALLGVSAAASANPQDGVVAAGNASITSSGKKLDVMQSTDKAIIDWRGFDIAPDEHTQFHQPNSGSITLNRVNSNAASQINGKLTANGNIVIVNQNGIMFGAGAKVDVNGLVATTADIDNDKFMNGDPLKFDKPGNPNASIVNAGQITAKDAGLVGFVAPNVQNSGIIQAKMGRVHLASGDTATVDFYGDGLMQVSVSDAVKSQLVSNTGSIEADGGKVALTASAGKEIVNSLIRAEGSVRAQSVGVQNGEIIIDAAGSTSKVEVGGTLDASGALIGEKGGSITVTGQAVTLKQSALLDASGQSGGGQVRVGGEYQGAALSAGGLALKNAQELTVEHGAKINVSAKQNGNGGRAILWADKKTSYHGNVEAKGGAQGGAGGFVETSGKEDLTLVDANGNLGLVDTRDAFGDAGIWLLDPTDITLVDHTQTGNGSNIFSNIDLQNMSVSSNISLSATNDIILNMGGDTATLANNRSLTLTAGRDIYTQSGGSFVTYGVTDGIVFTAGRNILFDYNNPINIQNNYADIKLNAAGNINLRSGGLITSYFGRIILNSDTDSTNGGAILVGLGSRLKTTNNDIILGGGSNPDTGYAVGSSGYDRGVEISDGAVIDAGAANILIHGKGWGDASCFNSCYGAYIRGGTLKTTGNGKIDIFGIGGGDGSTYYNHGIEFPADAGGNLIQTQNGDITVTSYTSDNGPGAGSIGGANTLIKTTGASGDIIFKSTHSNDSFYFYQNAVVNSASTISNISDKWDGATDFSFIAAGDIIIRPTNSGRTVGVGSGSNDLQVTDAYLSKLTSGGTVWIGGYGNVGDVGYISNAGRLTLNSSATVANNLHLVSNDEIRIDQSNNTLTLASGKNLTLTATNNIYSASNGNIALSGMGNLLFEAGNDVSFNNNLSMNAGTGSIRFNANAIGINDNTTNITTQGGDLIFNANRDNSGYGAILVEGHLNTNGGDAVFGGGTNPYTQNAVGYFSQGIRLVYAVIHTGGGDVVIHGSGGTDGSNNVQGVGIQISDIFAEGGNITMNGVGMVSQNCTNCEGIIFENAHISTTGSGTISLTGTGGGLAGGTNGNYGLRFFGSYGDISSLTTANSDIILNGSATETAASALGIGLTDTTFEATGAGNVSLSSLKGITSGSNTSITTHGGDVTINAHSGSITTQAITTGAGDITLTSDDVVIQGDYTGTGTLTLQPFTSGKVVRVNYMAGDYNLDNSELAHLKDGWSLINIGDKDNPNQMFIGATTWSDSVAFRSNHVKQMQGAITLTGATSSITFLNGWTDINYDITTAGGNVSFTNDRPDAAVGFDAGVAYGYTSTIASHGGDILFNRIVNVGALALNSANGDITFNDGITGNYSGSLDSLTMNAGSGDIAVLGAIKGNFGGGGFDLTATGHALNFDSEIGDPAAMRNITLVSANTDITLRAINSTGNTSVNAGSGKITLTEAVNTGSGNLTLISDDVDIQDALTGTGTLALQTSSIGRTVRINDGAGDYNLTTAEIGHLSNGWSEIDIGRLDSSASMYIGAITFNDPVKLLTASNSYVDGNITGAGNASISIIGQFGSNLAHLTGDITTAGGNVTTNQIHSSGGNIFTHGGDATFGLVVDQSITIDTAGGDINNYTLYEYIPNSGVGDTVTLTAGSGNISFSYVDGKERLIATANGFTFSNPWGSLVPLGGVSLTSATSFSLPAITANGDVSLNAGTGTITAQAVSVGAHNLTMTADDLDLQGNLSGTGTLALQPYSNNKLIRLDFYAGDFNLDAAELGRLSDGWSEIDIGNHNAGTAISSNYTGSWKDPIRFLSQGMSVFGNMNASGNGSFTFDNGVRISGTVNVTTAGGDVHFLNNVEFDTAGNRSLNITSNNGDITFDGYFKDFGGGANIFNSSSGTGQTTFSGDVEGHMNFYIYGSDIVFGGGFGNTSRVGDVSIITDNSISLPSMYADDILVISSHDITLGSGTTLSTTFGGADLILKAGGNVINNGVTLSSGGRWQIFSADASTAVGLNLLSSNFRRYGCGTNGVCVAGVTIPGAGNGLIFAAQPTLTITPDALGSHITYGDAVPTLSGYSYTASGYLFGDTGGLSGSLTGSTDYAQGSNIGTYKIQHGSGTLTSSQGYLFTYADNNTGITVDKRVLTASLASTASKMYDGTVNAILTAGNYLLTNIYNMENVTVSGSTATYDTKHSGSGKTVSVSGLTLGGTAAGNYVLASASASGAIGTITAKDVTITANADAKIFGATDPIFTYSHTALGTGDTNAVFSGALARTAGESIGSYSMLIGTLTAGTDYTLHFTSALFDILGAPPVTPPLTTPPPIIQPPVVSTPPVPTGLPTTVVRVSQDASINQSGNAVSNGYQNNNAQTASGNGNAGNNASGKSTAPDNVISQSNSGANQNTPTQTIEEDPAFLWMRGLLRVEPKLARRMGMDKASIDY